MRHNELQERFAQEAITRGLEQRTNEEKLIHLYARYCVTGEKDCLSDILLYAEKLCWRIAWSRLSNNTFFKMSEFEDCLQELAVQLLEQLKRDFDHCIKQENIVGRIRSHYSNRSISIYRKLCQNEPTENAISLDELNTGEDGKPKDPGIIVEPPIADSDDQDEQKELSQSLFRLYLENMLNYKGEPQKVLSLCYARVLYHLQSQLDPDEIERLAERIIAQDDRSQTDDEIKHIEAIQKAQVRKTATSVIWARKRMADKTILFLTDESESVLKAHYHAGLCWGDEIRASLDEHSPYCDGSIWGNLVYTDVFSEKDTTAWAQSIHASVTHAVCKQINDTPELRKLVLQYDTPLKSPFRKEFRKGGEKNASVQR